MQKMKTAGAKPKEVDNRPFDSTFFRLISYLGSDLLISIAELNVFKTLIWIVK